MKKCKIRKTYSKEFKVRAAKRHIEDGVSYLKVAREFDIHEQMIMRWCKTYRSLGEDGLKEKRGTGKGPLRGRPSIKNITKDDQILKLKAENEYLKNLLQLERR